MGRDDRWGVFPHAQGRRVRGRLRVAHLPRARPDVGGRGALVGHGRGDGGDRRRGLVVGRPGARPAPGRLRHGRRAGVPARDVLARPHGGAASPGATGPATDAFGHATGAPPVRSAMATMDHTTGTPPASPSTDHLVAAVTHGLEHVMGGLPSTGMLAAHLLAALLCGLWLAHGERAAFRILRALAGWLTAPLRPLLGPSAPAYRPPARARRARTDGGPRRYLLIHAITSRGPPAGAAVAV